MSKTAEPWKYRLTPPSSQPRRPVKDLLLDSELCKAEISRVGVGAAPHPRSSHLTSFRGGQSNCDLQRVPEPTAPSCPCLGLDPQQFPPLSIRYAVRFREVLSGVPRLDGARRDQEIGFCPSFVCAACSFPVDPSNYHSCSWPGSCL